MTWPLWALVSLTVLGLGNPWGSLQFGNSVSKCLPIYNRTREEVFPKNWYILMSHMLQLNGLKMTPLGQDFSTSAPLTFIPLCWQVVLCIYRMFSVIHGLTYSVPVEFPTPCQLWQLKMLPMLVKLLGGELLQLSPVLGRSMVLFEYRLFLISIFILFLICLFYLSCRWRMKSNFTSWQLCYPF